VGKNGNGNGNGSKGTVCCMCGASMEIDLTKLPGNVTKAICHKCFEKGTKGEAKVNPN